MISPPILTAARYNKDKKPELTYGRYLVVRKDGKTHLETWNGTGWAYNNNVIEWYYLPQIN